LIEDNAEKIAVLLTEEHGKTLNDAHGEIIRGLEIIEFACGAHIY
jgi:malonate-semialdehyde dehydrogenase (acetylating)/methylmalonate-semialdehyde dehydrogenase